MKIEQGLWIAQRGWTWDQRGLPGARLVLCFGAPMALEQSGVREAVVNRYGQAILAVCSTGGEIHGAEVFDDSVTAIAFDFDHTEVEAVSARVAGAGLEAETGRFLAQGLFKSNLAAVLVLSDGTQVNGSELIRGFRQVLGERVVITGGLAGDGPHFIRTLTGLNGTLESGQICAIGLYGDRIRVGHGSAGGWDVFGPERRVTRADGRLYELDGKPALDLYKAYLGEEAERLPGSALLFPLQIFPAGAPEGALVRTVVGIEEDARAMVFAGDIPEGWGARLMRGNFDHLVQGAAEAAHQANAETVRDRAAILVSCIGRKLLMGQRIAEEVEAVQTVLGPRTAISGFYSYGEISPHAQSGVCELHNQTMTITTLWEE
ncbi:MAG TPA: hypothetical protein DCL54_13970 [Alphaproteobacteria bacterium]|nr:hypothetical protein [Alphaproteobacteria bacterium]